MNKPSALLFLVLLLAPATQAAPAAVAMPDRYSAETATEIIKAGGNAVDAAVAAAFVLAVTYPEAGNIGGGGFLTVYMDGEPAFLDFRETAPGKAERDMYLDEGGNFVQRESLVGGKASGVPGTVAGLAMAHQRMGTLPWRDLLAPAISLAEDGFVVDPMLAAYGRGKVQEIAGETNFEEYFAGLIAGQRFKQPELAATLKRIADDPQEFYTGATARLLVEQMQQSGGLITLADLAAYRAVWREPIVAQWRDFTIITAPPPSSGGIALVQLLKIRDYAQPLFTDVWQNSAQYIHLLAEIEKRVFADRAEYLGDPDFIDNPVAALIDERYLEQRAQAIDPNAISSASSVGPGLESPDTTHFSITDSKGNAASLTYTLNWDFGSGVVVEGAGFLMNNEMDDFSAKVGVKNEFGVIGNERNAIAPNKRMLSSMTPTILLKDAKPALVVGTPGGSTIFTSVFQSILNVYDYGLSPQEAVNATRFHHQLPDATVIRHDQREIAGDTLHELTNLGYKVQPNSWGNLGDVQLIRIVDGKAQAASDNRGRGVAVVLP
ncbi:gamma-glutamyltransferase [Parahalioglobus pacificus]|uniref:Glutathione hydrolase proenzyme n=1 Tax=Parahalioglobus pacificus TaxID=930806 RepID=A0A918XHR8_9GAMM|nr:gamma-glutamyltransferase [Halioglobus pacificus]GHD31243.1 gamma-glutamyltranspeptidase [Halioglobus pacificus]